MNIRVLLIAVSMLAWTGLAGFAGAQAPASPERVASDIVLQNAVTEVFRPHVLGFAHEASGLESAMQGLCAAPSEQSLAIAEQAFARTVVAYGAVDFLRLGPLMEDNRAERLLFWPDRRSIGLRQVQAILVEQDASATTLESLQGKSVAVQGLGALEFVLFGTGAPSLAKDEGAYRCAYGQAVAANVAAIAEELVVGWFLPGGIADHLQAPSPDYADYRNRTETLEATVGLVAHGAEGLRDRYLKPFLAGEDKAASPKLAVFWRSGLTTDFLRANVEGMRDLMARSGLARAVDEQHLGLDNTIDFEFRNALRALDLVTAPVTEAVKDDKQAFALDYLVLVTGSLQTIVGEQLSAALGLSVGFSSLDGD